MTVQVEKLVREFKYGSLALADPDPAQTPEEVKAFYAGIYPELNNAEIEGPDRKGDKTVYEFRKAVGTKGGQPATGPQRLRDILLYLTSRRRGKSRAQVVESAQASIEKGLSAGTILIAHERERQIESLGYTQHHDDAHGDDSLSLAAVCYATPAPAFILEERANGYRFRDPWPETWDSDYDRRPRNGKVLISPEKYSPKLRIRCLVKAGALIAAEIDRLLRDERTRGKG